MKKIIKRIGNSICITFSKEEKKIYDLKSGDVIDFEIIKVK